MKLFGLLLTGCLAVLASGLTLPRDASSVSRHPDGVRSEAWPAADKRAPRNRAAGGLGKRTETLYFDEADLQKHYGLTRVYLGKQPTPAHGWLSGAIPGLPSTIDTYELRLVGNGMVVHKYEVDARLGVFITEIENFSGFVLNREHRFTDLRATASRIINFAQASGKRTAEDMKYLVSVYAKDKGAIVKAVNTFTAADRENDFGSQIPEGSLGFKESSRSLYGTWSGDNSLDKSVRSMVDSSSYRAYMGGRKIKEVNIDSSIFDAENYEINVLWKLS